MKQLSYKQLTALPVVIVILLILYVNYLMNNQLEEYARFSHQENQLHTLNHVAEYLENQNMHSAVEMTLQIATISQITGKRLTLIDIEGKVIADSALNENGLEVLDNHSQRPEIISVMQNPKSIGVSWRYSKTLKRNLLYTAKTLQFNNSTVVLRIAMPQNEVYQNLSIYRQLFYISATIALLFVAGIGFLIVRHINRRIENDHRVLEQKVKQRTQEIVALNDITARLSACNDYDELYGVLTTSCEQLLPKACGALALYRSSQAHLSNVVTWGLCNSSSKQTFATDSCWALKTSKSHLKQIQTRGCPHNDTLELPANQLCIPLTTRGESLGVLQLYSDDNDYLEQNHTTISSLCENLSLALAGLFLLDELRNQALHDPLTGLFNRRYLDDVIKIEINRSKHHNTPLAAMMIDADHFKHYNDTHGHDAGDYVLQQLTTCILDTIRSEDIACRYGGEEFVILLPQTSKQAAIEIAQRLRQTIINTPLQFKDKVLPNITLSIGIAIYSSDSTAADNVLEQADSAMYFAKQHGRDQIIYFGDIQA